MSVNNSSEEPSWFTDKRKKKQSTESKGVWRGQEPREFIYNSSAHLGATQFSV